MSYTDAGFQNPLTWTPSFTPEAGAITNVSVTYAKYFIAGKLLFYQFKATMDLSLDAAYIRATMPVSFGSALPAGDVSVGIGVYNDGLYVSCYALKFDADEAYINKYDGSDLTAGSNRLVTMEGKYEID